MLAIAALRCSPRASAEGSFHEAPSLPAVEAGAGDGVAGGCALVDCADCAGAAGTDGVETAFGAGVAGSAGLLGAALGCADICQTMRWV
jgi:hypothetical protein